MIVIVVVVVVVDRAIQQPTGWTRNQPADQPNEGGGWQASAAGKKRSKTKNVTETRTAPVQREVVKVVVVSKVKVGSRNNSPRDSYRLNFFFLLSIIASGYI